MTLSTPTLTDTIEVIIGGDQGVPAEVYIIVVVLTFIVIGLVAVIAEQFVAQGDLDRFKARFGRHL